jgi:hypothetical protein
MLHCFQQLLQLPPFPLRALEAALCPGPFPEGSPWQQHKPARWFPPSTPQLSAEPMQVRRRRGGPPGQAGMPGPAWAKLG